MVSRRQKAPFQRSSNRGDKQVLEYYSQQQKLREVDGNQNIDQVQKALLDEINVFKGSVAKG